tara:strand:- start:18065 stop:18541 length:477 start_codon:yes stop_codon:yes gene_type:complete
MPWHFWHHFGKSTYNINQKEVKMKKGLLILSVLILFASCDVVVIEAPYDPRDNFTGRYTVEEYSETYDVLTKYNVRIIKEADPYSNVVYIRNFYAADIEVFADVHGDRLTIPRQIIDGYVIQGTGRLDYGDLVLSYSVEDRLDDSSLVDFCNTVYFRR